MSTVSVTVRINDDLLMRLKARAESEHRTLSNMINSILSDSFNIPKLCYPVDDVEKWFTVAGAFISSHANDNDTRQIYWDFVKAREACYPILYPEKFSQKMPEDA